MKFIGRHIGLKTLKDDMQYYEINAAQVFTKAPQQWFGTFIPESMRLKYNKEKYYVCAHAGYLINLANRQSPSRQALLHEADRCALIGIPDLVVHPGSGDPRVVIDTLNALVESWPCTVRLLLENTAGQGNYIGGRLEELEYIIQNVSMPIGICYDTAHAWGHGNSIVDDLNHPMIQVIHLNDSQVMFGSRKDRHANLCKGTIPAEIFNDIAHRVTVPIIMETPETYAIQDLQFFKSLVK